MPDLSSFTTSAFTTPTATTYTSVMTTSELGDSINDAISVDDWRDSIRDDVLPNESKQLCNLKNCVCFKRLCVRG